MTLMRCLLAAAVVLPALIFGASAWFGYRAAVASTERDLAHASEVAAEQAENVFDGQYQLIDRVHDLLHGLDVAGVVQNEKALHEELAAIIARLPQAQGIAVADATGHPLAAANTYPIPAGLTIKDRDFFRAVIGERVPSYVSSLQAGARNRRLFFGLARPWVGAPIGSAPIGSAPIGSAPVGSAPVGSVLGVINAAISPQYFRDFYKILVNEGDTGAEGKVVTLVRDDGQILVRYPDFDGPPPHAGPHAAFYAAIRENPRAGTYRDRSIVDAGAPTRIFAYRRVRGYPLYTVAGRSRDVVVSQWMRQLAGELAFGIPAQAALVAVTWLALRTTRREAAALSRALREIGLREQAEAALLRAQRLEAIGQVTGGVAHDFNNLLMIVMGSAELLQKAAADPARVTRLAGQIMIAAKHGGAITQQLLSFSRRQLVRPEIVDLNGQIETFRPLLDQAASQSIRIALDLDAARPRAMLDAAQFEAAVLNLVGNARDAMPQGGVVRIRTRTLTLAQGEYAELPAGRYASVAVIDSGVGMDASTAARAFEPFFTTKGVGRGTGLGLSQVYGFTKQAGGDLRIMTAPGAGTTMELLLPSEIVGPAEVVGPAEIIAPAEVEAAGLQSGPPRAEPTAVAHPASRGEVVLVVEDDEGVLQTASEHLRDLGYAVVAARDAASALAWLRGPEPIDVLFSDVILAGNMNGVELSVAAKRMRPGLKVLLTSGYTANADQGREIDAPVLAKPYDRAQLLAFLEQA